MAKINLNHDGGGGGDDMILTKNTITQKCTVELHNAGHKTATKRQETGRREERNEIKKMYCFQIGRCNLNIFISLGVLSKAAF